LVNGVRHHFIEANEAGCGPLVVLLHGFPEFWYSWRHQIPALARAGFRVVAPDLRGYNQSEKPQGVKNYRLSLLVEDVACLIRELGETRASVVGHDWGGALAWAFAMRRPDLVDRLAVLNAPHPAAFRREMRNPRQWLRSWYMFFFQLPYLPEWWLQANHYALLESMMRLQPARPGAFTEDDIRRYKEALAQPGARTATVNWYRALFRYPGEMKEVKPILAPTLLVWGERDPYLGVNMTRGLERWVPDLRVVRLPGVSHWVQNDEPAEVNRLLLEFLTAGRVGEGMGTEPVVASLRLARDKEGKP
jgi:pimeloyl-ACP methyl ester carboxylesterase